VGGVEGQGVDFDAEGRDVLALELAAHVSLHEGRLARTAIADEHHLEAQISLIHVHARLCCVDVVS
jgi:hypothetical protein